MNCVKCVQGQSLLQPSTASFTDPLEAVLDALRQALAEGAGSCQDIPDRVAVLLQSGGLPEASTTAAAALWMALAACMQLGLPANASLALSAAVLHTRVQSAQGG